MTTSAIFPGRCPVCEGDLQFGRGLDGLMLKCLQCTRVVTQSQALEILMHLRRVAEEKAA